jgi:hypothetical protein
VSDLTVTNFHIAVELLDESAREFFEERAAIIEYMGKFPRVEAERLALVETRKFIASRTQ